MVVVRRWLDQSAQQLLLICFALATFGFSMVQLEIAKGEWHPEADDGMALSVYAFGESGRPLQNPGPLIRVQQGTEIHASLWNKLPVPIAVHGLGDSGSDSVVRVAPGATEQVRFRA